MNDIIKYSQIIMASMVVAALYYVIYNLLQHPIENNWNYNMFFIIVFMIHIVGIALAVHDYFKS